MERTESWSRRVLVDFFVDPLTVKELSGISRRWQTYVGRCLYVGLLGGVLWIFWNSMVSRGALRSPSAFAELARGFFVTFLTVQMLASTLGGVSAGADLITREIRSGTLGLLALTPLSSWRIASGKWKAAMLQASTGLVCGVPVFAILAYLGGTGLLGIAYSFTLSAACAALGAAVGLFWSTVFRAGYAATIASIVTLLAYCILPALLLIDTGEDGFTFLSWVHPAFAAIGAVTQATFGSRYAARAFGWIPATLLAAFQVWVLLRWSASRIGDLVLGSGGGASTASVAAPSAPSTSGFARLLRGKGEVWERNAILWKELSTRRLGMGTAARIGLVILGFFLLTSLVDGKGGWRITTYWISWFILVLVALAGGISLFVTEREERKWDVLLSTPLDALHLVLAKLLAGLAGLAPLALSLSVFWTLTELAFGITFRTLLMSLGSQLLLALLAYVLGAVASLLARTQRAAFSTAFGILIGLLFVAPILLLMFQSYAGGWRDRDQVTFLIGCTNPAPYMAQASELLSRSGGWGGHDEYLLGREATLWPMFVAYAGLYTAAIGLLTIGMIGRFDRATGRS